MRHYTLSTHKARHRRLRQAFTMAELLVASCIFLIAVVGIVYSYLKCMELAEIGRNASLAVQEVRTKMEEIKAANFSTVLATYNNTTFNVNNLNGKGVIYINNTNPDLLVIKVVFCWKQQGGRLIGEDADLDGVLDAGEDKNANGQLDSYVQVVTNLYG